ncbi:hypothetical protein CO038_00680 [Candidatus Pacearchaeota archaeon CG_4_9_14_0_2_um_filter_39_13]|nr:MAG: hypothetical protein AUJ64_01855 [Candidatus Pacearchaeota archaeon CG1_02_39_14]PJC45023.1 MAG: hypothetical protein CO038_00680 [Candidatus Pacearchaeota archaeon CG_4_9_14_0_2_um_filter_39_13]
MKVDPYKYKERYLAWRERIKDRIPEMNKENSDVSLAYLDDMHIGANIAQKSVKGARSYSRLDGLRDKLNFYSRQFTRRYGLKCITEVTENQIILFFSDMRKGIIKRPDGKPYMGIDNFVRDFKSFWHWWIKVNRKKGNTIPDITQDLDTRREKPDWVYLTEEEIKKLAENANYKYRVLIMFLFDSGIRAPTELMNVKVSDLYNDCKELNIRQEGAKTFGRRIKLMLCSEMVKNYIKWAKLQPEQYLFKFSPRVVNRQLKRMAKKLFEDKPSPAGESYWQITMYDFRHNSCCYWLPRYKSESALKYRFGWKKSDKIHYYSELLGMKDTIVEEDLLIDTTKTEIEKKLASTEREKDLMEEKMRSMELQMEKVMELMKQVEVLRKV